MRLVRAAFLTSLLLSTLSVWPVAAFGQEQWHHAVAQEGEPKYGQDFERFDYVNPDAPKGGKLSLSADGSFDSLNIVLPKGQIAAGAALIYETLMTPSLDEVSVSYGLLAEAIAYPDDFSWVKFRLRPNAKWHDGQPVTPEDVVWSFEKWTELHPLYRNYYASVEKAEIVDDDTVQFTFREKGNRELPLILGQLTILPKHYWDGGEGKPDISQTTLDIPLGSGPYKIGRLSAGSTLVLERVEDYWGADLPVRIGTQNFDTISYLYFTDNNAQFEAFKAGQVDFWRENIASRWATGFDFPAVRDGRIKIIEPENEYRNTAIMQAMVPNQRRKPFDDIRVREALAYAFDFETLNRTVFYDQYTRVNSFFFHTELASSGLPEGKELAILEEVRDLVPEDIFTEPFENSTGGTREQLRQNLGKAIDLLKQAGFELRDRKMTDIETGRQLSLEILLSSPTLEKVALPYAQNLKRIGIDASVRSVDASQYENRLRDFDFDVTWEVWAQTLFPGNEQAEYWGSKAADETASRNIGGIKDPGVDALIRKVIFAEDRDELIAATRALDRVLLANHFVIPMYYSFTARIAFWDRLAHPEEFPEYSTGFPDIWWYDPNGTSAK